MRVSVSSATRCCGESFSRPKRVGLRRVRCSTESRAHRPTTAFISASTAFARPEWCRFTKVMLAPPPLVADTDSTAKTRRASPNLARPQARPAVANPTRAARQVWSVTRPLHSIAPATSPVDLRGAMASQARRIGHCRAEPRGDRDLVFDLRAELGDDRHRRRRGPPRRRCRSRSSRGRGARLLAASRSVLLVRHRLTRPQWITMGAHVGRAGAIVQPLSEASSAVVHGA